jgi:phosphoadenosine phosphosulfate reductase
LLLEYTDTQSTLSFPARNQGKKIMAPFDIEQLQADLANKNPRTILKKAFELFDNIAISFSGAEDVVLIDMALTIRKDLQVFSLDTGRLHPETYRFIEKVRKHYQIDIDVLTPDREVLDNFVKRAIQLLRRRSP